MAFPNINVPKEIAAQFFALLKKGKVCEAVNLLPDEDRIKFPQCSVNTTNSTYVNASVVTYTEKTIISGLEQVRTSETLAAVYGWIILVTSILGILGNSTVIATYLHKILNYKKMSNYKEGSKKSVGVAKLLFLHLAFCDFLFAVFQLVIFSPSIHKGPWPYGIPLCKIIMGSHLLGSLVAIGTILVIASERYMGSIKLKMSKSKKPAFVKILLVWAFGLFSIIPYLIALKVNQKTGICEANWIAAGMTSTGSKVYDIFLLAFWFLLPCSFIIYFYGSMVNLLRKPLEQRGLGGVNLAKRRQNDIRAVRILLAVTITFIILCLPIRIVRVVLHFIDVNKLSQKEFFGLFYAGWFPYPIHVCCNPIIYSVIDKKFRQDFTEMFRHSSQPRKESATSLSRILSRFRGSRHKKYSVSTQMESLSTRKATASTSPSPNYFENISYSNNSTTNNNNNVFVI